MNHPPKAISLQRANELVEHLNRLSQAENTRSAAFRRQVLQVLRTFDVDLRTTIRSSQGRHTGVNAIGFLLPEVNWGVMSVLSDWKHRYHATGYDFVAAWSEVSDFQGC